MSKTPLQRRTMISAFDGNQAEFLRPMHRDRAKTSHNNLALSSSISKDQKAVLHNSMENIRVIAEKDSSESLMLNFSVLSKSDQILQKSGVKKDLEPSNPILRMENYLMIKSGKFKLNEEHFEDITIYNTNRHP